MRSPAPAPAARAELEGAADDDTSWLDAAPASAPGADIAPASGMAQGLASAAPRQDHQVAERPVLAAAAGRRPASRSLWLGVMLALFAVFGTVFALVYMSRERERSENIQTRDANETAAQDLWRDANGVSHPRQPAFLRVTRAEFVVGEQPPPDRALFGWLLCFATLVALGWMWARFGRGRWMPRPGARRADGPGARAEGKKRERRTLETLMLDERDEEELVWGVGRFVSSDTSRELDVERTVRETASAFGRPVLVYQGIEYQREVWLWVDESLDTPVARELADDLARMLEHSGLPVMRATFWGVPERLRTAGDEVLTIDAFDSRRDGVAVAILSDGRMMNLAHQARNRRHDVDNLLRNLSYWPRVTFIDFGGGQLTSLVEGRGLRVIEPEHAASAISEYTEPYLRPARYDALFGDASAWAAACALSPRPVPDRMALTLRQELALDVSPWAVERMRAKALESAGGIDFSVAQRAALLGWLVEAEELPERPGRIPKASLLARAVEAWDRTLDRHVDAMAYAARRHGRDTPTRDGFDEIGFIRACVHLWTEPDRAAARLFAMHSAASPRERQEIERYLGHLGTREHAMEPAGRVILPWSLSQVRRETRVMLAELGLARGLETRGVRMSMPAPRRVWLAAGLGLGLFLGALGALANDYWFTERPAPIFRERGVRPQSAYVERERLDNDTWSAVVGTPWSEPVRATVRRGDAVILDWSPGTMPCEQPVSPGVTGYFCAQGDGVAEALQPVDHDFWSFAIIVDEYPDPARKVAEELLHSGSVQGVFRVASDADMAEIAMDRLARPGGGSASESWDQLLVVASAVPENLEQYSGRAVVVESLQVAALVGAADDFEGWRSLAEVRPRIEPLRGDARDFRVRGAGICGGLGEVCCTDDRAACEAYLACRGGVCTSVECADVEPDRCADERTLEVCVAEKWQSRPCADGQICDEEKGACRALTCDDLGCAPDERCEAMQCVKKSCRSESEVQCNKTGTSYRRCDVERGDWGRQRACPAGSLCDDDHPCRPIEGALIELVSVSHDGRAADSAAWSYQMRCTVRSRARRLVKEFKLDTGVARAALEDGEMRLPHDESPANIRLSCQLSELRPTQSSASIRGDIGKPTMAQATHAWNLRAIGTHELDFGRKAGNLGHVVLRYTIALSTGFDGLGASPSFRGPEAENSAQSEP